MTLTLETTGIESETVDAHQTTLGHVVMLDYDDAPLSVALEDAEALRGPTVVVSSSTDSWHVYGLEIRSWDDVVVALEDSRASREYVREMTRRGTATLRITEKVDPHGETITGKPVPVAVGVTRPADPIPVSRPHVSQLRSMAEAAGIEKARRRLELIEAGAIDGLEPVGEMLARSRYETRGGDL